MAAPGTVWTRRPALRVLGEIVATTADLPRWWGSVALGMGTRLGSVFVGRRVLRRSYLGPLIEKSAVLSGATVTLHGVEPAPWLRTELPRYRGTRHYHVLDVTVRPLQTRPGIQKWSPADLALVAPGALPAFPEEDEEVGQILRAERWHRDQFVEVDGSPLFGSQRLRLHVGLVAGERRFHFRYYLALLRRQPDRPQPGTQRGAGRRVATRSRRDAAGVSPLSP